MSMNSRMALGLGLALTAIAAGGDETMIQGLFRDTGTGLSYAANGWSVRSEGTLGWVSLKVGESEFFSAEDTRGAVAVRKGDRWITAFPDRGTISHDDSVARFGNVADGINLIRISPDWYKPEFELYLGANETQDQSVVVFLGDEVAFVRAGGRMDSNRASTQAVVTRETKGSRKTREALIVHSGGRAIQVKSELKGKNAKGEEAPPPEFEVALLPDPAGKPRLALSFPCKGFVANSFRFIVDAKERPENFVAAPRFDVISSDDPAGRVGLGAAHGALSPLYGPDTKLDFGIQFNWMGGKPFNGYAELEVVHSLGQPHFTQRVELADKPAGLVRAVFAPRFHLPGVSEVWGRLVDAGGNLIWTGRYRMAYDWEHMKPVLRVEPDFKAFWDETLAALRAEPLDPVFDRVKAYEDHPSFEIYDVTFNGWNRTRTHAMLFVPKNGTKPMPAIVTAHPGVQGFGVNKRADGVYGSELKQDPRFVTIVPLIRGHAPDAPDIPFNHPWWGPLQDRDTYVARAWYCAMVRAVDILASRPDLVDMTRVVAKGGSQGGALALVTAALDPRVVVCLADCPANCQPSEIMRNYSSFGPSSGQVPPGQSLENVETMLSYYNPVNFCPLIRCPAYVGSNIGDLTVHSMGPLAAYHNLTGVKPEDKAFYPGYTHFHGSGPGLGVKSKEWLDKLGGRIVKGP
jgi:cephalosporin-C deacetylase-like acetyl esterase